MCGGGFALGLALAVAAGSAARAADGPEVLEPRHVTRYLNDVTYTAAVPTAHREWAKPLVGGPIRLFVIPTVRAGRDVVELAQRMEVRLTTVTVDPDWWLNAVGLGDFLARRGWRERAPARATYRIVEGYLRVLVNRARHYDCYLLPTFPGWCSLPVEVREAILADVRLGAGLILIGPRADADVGGVGLGAVSPLVPVGGEGGEGGHFSSVWRRTGADHFITRGLPLEALSVGDLPFRRYRAAGRVLVVDGAGDCPIVAVRRLGRGRVVAFAWESDCLFPRSSVRPSPVPPHRTELIYSLLCRAVLWAAGREPAAVVEGLALEGASPPVEVGRSHRVLVVRVADRTSSAPRVVGATPAGVVLRFLLRDETGRLLLRRSTFLLLGAGSTCEFRLPLPALPGGLNRLDCILTDGRRVYDWFSLCLPVVRGARIDLVQLREERLQQRGVLAGEAEVRSVQPGELTLTVSLFDRWGRLLGRREYSRWVEGAERFAFALRPLPSLSPTGELRLGLFAGGRYCHSLTRTVFFDLPRDIPGPVLGVREEGVTVVPPRWREAVEEQYLRLGVRVLITDVPSRAEGSRFRIVALLRMPSPPPWDDETLEWVAERGRVWGRLSPLFYLVRVPGGGERWLDAVGSALRRGDPFARVRSDRWPLGSLADDIRRSRGFFPAESVGSLLLRRLLQPASVVELGRRFTYLNPDLSMSAVGREVGRTWRWSEGMVRLLCRAEPERGGATAPGFTGLVLRDGPARYLVLLDQPTPPLLRLGRGYHLYLSRPLRGEGMQGEGGYIGRREEVSLGGRSAPLLLTLLPHRLVGLHLEVPGEVRAGTTLHFTCRLRSERGLVGRHALRVEVEDSCGRVRPEYGTVLEGGGGVFFGEVPLALNDPVGRWRLHVREVVTGLNASAEFRLLPPVPSAPPP